MKVELTRFDEETLRTISPILCKCSCFSGIPEEKYKDVLKCLKAKLKHFKKNEGIQNTGDSTKTAGIVISGIVELILYSESGGQINVNRYGPGELFGEDIACYPESKNEFFQMWAVTDCSILFIDFSTLLSDCGCTCKFKMKVSVNLLKEFARKSRFLSDKVRILAQKRLRDKIKVYLQMQPVDSRGMIHLPFNRSELAEFLSVDRCALCRELGRMQEEKILTVTGKTIQILDNSFLK